MTGLARPLNLTPQKRKEKTLHAQLAQRHVNRVLGTGSRGRRAKGMRARWTRVKDPTAVAEMKALVEAYRGPISYCPPLVARAHEAKPRYEPPPRRGGLRGTGRQAQGVCRR
jgi:hypothetical protein